MNLAATCIERTHRGVAPRAAITAPPNEHRDFVDEGIRLRTFEISALSRDGHVERYTPPPSSGITATRNHKEICNEQ
ncbi:hypothetical protein [Pseudoxanthomonas indica]|uniref:Uncharacterized protein n=1 Tax=Pseudoxanthomonas indica TaxID=428993 RepID=A0A1T5JDZ3_9GAMM|nr:hypothetical protein [Pseudoxanthomonas indica]SKC49502.1 hypothetical protein SAMN06296058_0718 [Pseudoxanthomonas indica]